MKLSRRQFLHLAAGAAAAPAVLRIAWAQSYHLIVGFPPGGGNDIVARLMGQWLSERLGQPVVIENRPGAATSIATETVVRAPPDGYTLLFVAPSSAINATLYEKLNFNFVHDIAPVAGILRIPNVMVVNPSVATKTVPEFIAYAKSNPGKINMASPGVGTSVHLSGELGPRSVQGRGACAHGFARRTGAGHVRNHALVNRVHQGREAARAGGDHIDARHPADIKPE
jgi:tripartite-type tricarboxylate transporter receptor subunit TctC